MTAGSSGPGVGLTVTHRRYVSDASAHYAGDLVDGAFVLALFGDVATEMCIRTDGDEGLFASYSDVQFVAAVRVVARGDLERGGSAADLLDPPVVATTARGVVVVPPR